MKLKSSVRWCAAGLVLAAFCVATRSALAQTGATLPATVLRLKGHARYTTDNVKTWQMIKAGDVLMPGTLVQTARESQLDLLLGGDAKARRGLKAKDFYNPDANHGANLAGLSENTLLKLDKLTRTSSDGGAMTEEIQLDLSAGMILGNFSQPSPGSKYEVAFVGGVAGMKSAVYQLRAGGELAVLGGKVWVALADGQPAREVVAGRQFNPATGQITELPPQDAPASRPAGSDKSLEQPKPTLPPNEMLPFGRARPPARR